jgi:hypothetical protein
MPSCAPPKLRARQDTQEGKEDTWGPSHALDVRKKATKSKLIQTLKLNHTVQAKPVRPVFIIGQTGLTAILSPSKDEDEI